MLTLDELEARDFTLSERDGLVLVQPGPLKNLKRSAWKQEELMYRSAVIEKESGQIVSLGFPKFFNYGEGGPSNIENSRLRKDLFYGKASLTEKLDGSLAIRYVYDGEVRWRTRGTLNDTPHTEAIKEVSKKYLALADPNLEPQYSLLFEFVHPDPLFRIVLRYPRPELYLIGAVSHDDGYMLPHNVLDILAKENSFIQAQTVTVDDGTEIEELLGVIDEWRGAEGVVARCGKYEQTLIKLKSADYLLRHRLKSSLSVQSIRDICVDNDFQTLEEFEHWMEAQGADWELLEDARPIVEKFIEVRDEAQIDYALLLTDVRINHAQYPDRGDFARNFANHLPIVQKGSSFMILDADLKDHPERRVKAWKMLLSNMLDEAYKGVVITERTAIMLAENE